MLYAPRTGTKANLAAMRKYGWRILVSAAADTWSAEGFPYAIDNGAWTYHVNSQPFDGVRFRDLVAELGAGADWIVLPDVVADAVKTAAMTEEWVDQLAGLRTLACIQNGAEERVLDRIVHRVFGFFLGGDDDYKLANIERWAAWCKERGLYYHVGRVNTMRRIRRCAQSGADSVDGRSAAMYSTTTPKITGWRDSALRQTAWRF